MKRAVIDFQLIAVAFLRHKSRSGGGQLNAIWLSIDDLAIDCVAPLFERDSTGEFSRLQTYFARVAWQAQTDEELLSHTRRLVFSCVNQGLAQMWRDFDPSLEKLLRNLTAAIKASSRLQILIRMGHNQVSLKPSEDSSSGREEMSQEYLEAMLPCFIREGISMKGVVDAIADILGEQETYRKEFPLVKLGIALRTVFARSTLPLVESQSATEDVFLLEEIGNSIKKSVTHTRQRMEISYVGKEKTSPLEYSRYFEVISRLLLARYAANDGDGLSLFSCLSELTPGLTFVDYRREHRAVLEYLFKLTESEFLASIKGRL